jgi:DNA repair photolyase
LKATETVEVGFTVTTDDERGARLFERHASSVEERLAAWERMHNGGLGTFAFIAPILPANPARLVKSLSEKRHSLRGAFLSPL